MLFRHIRYALAWALLILILCAIPGRELKNFSIFDIVNIDKWGHAIMFFVLCVLFIHGFSLQHHYPALSGSPRLISFVLCVLYGILTEVMQQQVEFIGRTANPYDAFANMFGCIIAVIIYQRLKPFLLRHFPMLGRVPAR